MTFGIYIHWPFCKSKCPYCDFNSHVHDKIDHKLWRDSYIKELDYWAELTKGNVVDTVFFGGGTPSLMEAETVADILAHIQKKWRVSNNWEVTLEANPTSFETEKFRDFYMAGVNRVSIGVQSFVEQDLKFLGREHSPDQARFAILEAQKIFSRVSFDLIYARPKQTIEGWQAELSDALKIATGHMSLYQLTIERGTPFHTRYARGEFQIPEQDLAADLYDMTQEMMDGAGLPAYEISNHARGGDESRHNLIYWRYNDYAGVGPGAHGRLTLKSQKLATRAHRAPEIWLDKVEKSGQGLHPFEEVDPLARLQEALMMGLRLKEGVPISRLESAFAGDLHTVLSPLKIKRLVDEGILLDGPDLIKTTPQGFKCLNAVLGYLLAS
jgi:putative oxygen-independent coproporphyrinogen III oxidase